MTALFAFVTLIVYCFINYYFPMLLLSRVVIMKLTDGLGPGSEESYIHPFLKACCSNFYALLQVDSCKNSKTPSIVSKQITASTEGRIVAHIIIICMPHIDFQVNKLQREMDYGLANIPNRATSKAVL